jgi:hypothetical protein
MGATVSELVGENVEIADVRWRGEEFVGFLRQGFSNGAAKMRLACRLVRERVECRTSTDRTEPLTMVSRSKYRGPMT